ncbi:MAG: hypothetical protein ACRD18_16520, partial [Terriglobia bacterium]
RRVLKTKLCATPRGDARRPPTNRTNRRVLKAKLCATPRDDARRPPTNRTNHRVLKAKLCATPAYAILKKVRMMGRRIAD